MASAGDLRFRHSFSAKEAFAIAILGLLFIFQLTHIALGYLGGKYLVVQADFALAPQWRPYWANSDLIESGDLRLRTYYPPYRSRHPVLTVSDDEIELTALVRDGVDPSHELSLIAADIDGRARANLESQVPGGLKNLRRCSAASDQVPFATDFYRARSADTAAPIEQISSLFLVTCDSESMMEQPLNLQYVRTVPYGAVKLLDLLSTLVVAVSILLFMLTREPPLGSRGS